MIDAQCTNMCVLVCANSCVFKVWVCAYAFVLPLRMTVTSRSVRVCVPVVGKLVVDQAICLDGKIWTEPQCRPWPQISSKQPSLLTLNLRWQNDLVYCTQCFVNLFVWWPHHSAADVCVLGWLMTLGDPVSVYQTLSPSLTLCGSVCPLYTETLISVTV